MYNANAAAPISSASSKRKVSRTLPQNLYGRAEQHASRDCHLRPQVAAADAMPHSSTAKSQALRHLLLAMRWPPAATVVSSSSPDESGGCKLMNARPAARYTNTRGRSAATRTSLVQLKPGFPSSGLCGTMRAPVSNAKTLLLARGRPLSWPGVYTAGGEQSEE